ncbi:phospholipase D-like domain-containing protein [Psychroserpens sp. MEBiC05023]
MSNIYKPVVRAVSGDYYGAALVGTYSTIIGWTFDDEALRDGLHGFGIKRISINPETDEIMSIKWLGGYKRFKATDTGKVEDVSSLEAPFQRFRWSDYSLKPHRKYTYEVYPLRGTPENLTRNEAPLIFKIRPTQEVENKLGVYVNRGVTSSMAYLSRFKNKAPKDIGKNAYQWLSRGLKESLLDFIAQAKSGDALHCIIYEFHDNEIAQAFLKAEAKGVVVKIIHDAKAGKHSTEKTEKVIHDNQMEHLTIPRDKVNISHNKVVILIRNQKPKKVWTASANFSENAFNFQTNAAIMIDNSDVAEHYEAFFKILKPNPTKKYTKIANRSHMDTINAIQGRYAAKTFFSPISKKDILITACDLILNAKSMVLISAPFGMDKRLVEAMGANDDAIIEYGIVNSTAKRRINGLHHKNTRFFTPNRLKTYMGRTWDAKAFGAHKIHTKIIIVDPYGDNPKVFFGSANFSEASCSDNDENAMLILNDKRLAAIMTVEFMRMYDHYKSRYYIRRTEDENKKIKKQNKERLLQGLEPKALKTIPIHLSDDFSWSRTSYSPTPFSHKFQDRIVFSGQ